MSLMSLYPYMIADHNFMIKMTTLDVKTFPEALKNMPNPDDRVEIVKQTIPYYYHQILFGRTNKNGKKIPSAITLLMGSPDYTYLLNSLFEAEDVTRLLSKITVKFDDWKLKENNFRLVYSAVSTLLNKKHVKLSILYQNLDKNIPYNRIAKIFPLRFKNGEKPWYIDEVYTWPEGFIPGEVFDDEAPKMKIDFDLLNETVPIKKIPSKEDQNKIESLGSNINEPTPDQLIKNLEDSEEDGLVGYGG